MFLRTVIGRFDSTPHLAIQSKDVPDGKGTSIVHLRPLPVNPASIRHISPIPVVSGCTSLHFCHLDYRSGGSTLRTSR